ncbi:hypothetical protein CLOM_g12265 [Closterium sp. NIES-68]|nr:hypothetical protein CLOM_g12265 [Closterium sp. NIES-68]
METAPTSKLDAPYSAPALAARIAVVGAGISGLVAASILAERGAHVAVFDLGRGPGGRMSQRREKITVSPLADASEAADLPSLEAGSITARSASLSATRTCCRSWSGGSGERERLRNGRGGSEVGRGEGEFIPEAGEDAGQHQGKEERKEIKEVEN